MSGLEMSADQILSNLEETGLGSWWSPEEPTANYLAEWNHSLSSLLSPDLGIPIETLESNLGGLFLDERLVGPWSSHFTFNNTAAVATDALGPAISAIPDHASERVQILTGAMEKTGQESQVDGRMPLNWNGTDGIHTFVWIEPVVVPRLAGDGAPAVEQSGSRGAGISPVDNMPTEVSVMHTHIVSTDASDVGTGGPMPIASPINGPGPLPPPAFPFGDPGPSPHPGWEFFGGGVVGEWAPPGWVSMSNTADNLPQTICGENAVNMTGTPPAEVWSLEAEFIPLVGTHTYELL